MAGNDQGEDKGCGQSEGREPAADIYSSLILATSLNSFSNTAISNTGTQESMAGLTFVSTTSVRNPCFSKNICTVCKKEFGCPRMYISSYVVCPYCNGTFLASEKASPPNVGSQQICQFDSVGTAMVVPDTTLRLGALTTDPSTMERKIFTENMDGAHEDGDLHQQVIRLPPLENSIQVVKDQSLMIPTQSQTNVYLRDAKGREVNQSDIASFLACTCSVRKDEQQSTIYREANQNDIT